MTEPARTALTPGLTQPGNALRLFPFPEASTNCTWRQTLAELLQCILEASWAGNDGPGFCFQGAGCPARREQRNCPAPERTEQFQ